jgi:hypothetical protein
MVQLGRLSVMILVEMQTQIMQQEPSKQFSQTFVAKAIC